MDLSIEVARFGKLLEVLDRLGRHIGPELEDHLACPGNLQSHEKHTCCSVVEHRGSRAGVAAPAVVVIVMISGSALAALATDSVV